MPPDQLASRPTSDANASINYVLKEGSLAGVIARKVSFVFRRLPIFADLTYQVYAGVVLIAFQLLAKTGVWASASGFVTAGWNGGEMKMVVVELMTSRRRRLVLMRTRM